MTLSSNNTTLAGRQHLKNSKNVSDVWGENCNMFVTENDSSAIIVKHINYNIPWRDSTTVMNLKEK